MVLTSRQSLVSPLMLIPGQPLLALLKGADYLLNEDVMTLISEVNMAKSLE